MGVIAILNLGYALTFLIAPGAAIAFAPALPCFPRGVRLLVAFVLSPLVVSAEIVVCTIVGLSFDEFLQYIAPLNLLGMLPILWTARRPNHGEPIYPAITLALLTMAPVFVFLYTVPYMREYGWHNMMQMSAILQFHRLPLLPEDMDLAGFRLNYGWLGFAQLATMSATAKLPAVLLFPGLNLLHFCCMFLLLVQSTRRSALEGAWLVSLATAVALLAPGMLDIAVALVTGGPPSGETRIEPMTVKYFTLDTMTLGLSSFSLLVYAARRALYAPERGIVTLMLVAALASGISYPLLFPSCAVLIGAVGICMLAGLCWPQFSRQISMPSYSKQSVVALAFGFGATALTVGAYIVTLSLSATTHPVRLAPRWGIRAHLTKILFVFGPVLLILLPVMLRAIRARAGRQLVILGVFGALLGCFTVLTMPVAVEYKFLFAGCLVVVPVLAAELARLATLRSARLALACSFVALQGAALWSLWHWELPLGGMLAHAVPLDESAELLHPSNGWEGSWMQAVRDRTPAETVLLTNDTDQPVAVFTGRALYVAADWQGLGRPDGGKAGRVGYTLDRRVFLVDVKGYPAAEVQARVALLYRCLATETDTADLLTSLSALVGLQRPVAFHFAGPAALLNLLRAENLGHAMFAQGADTVWLIAPAEFSRSNLLSMQ